MEAKFVARLEVSEQVLLMPPPLPRVDRFFLVSCSLVKVRGRVVADSDFRRVVPPLSFDADFRSCVLPGVLVLRSLLFDVDFSMSFGGAKAEIELARNIRCPRTTEGGFSAIESTMDSTGLSKLLDNTIGTRLPGWNPWFGDGKLFENWMGSKVA